MGPLFSPAQPGKRLLAPGRSRCSCSRLRPSAPRRRPAPTDSPRLCGWGLSLAEPATVIYSQLFSFIRIGSDWRFDGSSKVRHFYAPCDRQGVAGSRARGRPRACGLGDLRTRAATLLLRPQVLSRKNGACPTRARSKRRGSSLQPSGLQPCPHRLAVGRVGAAGERRGRPAIGHLAARFFPAPAGQTTVCHPRCPRSAPPLPRLINIP